MTLINAVFLLNDGTWAFKQTWLLITSLWLAWLIMGVILFVRDEETMRVRTIPIFIDSIKTLGGFQRTRCVYFRVEDLDGPISWPIGSPEGDSSVMLAWGSWAVIAGPRDGRKKDKVFDSIEAIEDMFESIEGSDRLSIELSHLWVPNTLLSAPAGQSSDNMARVYRISPELFRVCYRFSADLIDEGEWLEYCLLHKSEISPSDKEAALFAEWRSLQFKRASERYHSSEYADLRLAKKEGPDNELS